MSPQPPRSLLLPVFVVALLLVGWGAMKLSLDGVALSIGGSARGLFAPVFLLYLFERARARGWGPPTLHRDPVAWLVAVGALSILWNPGHHVSSVRELLFPGLAGYCVTRWLVEQDRERATLILRTLATALTLVVAYSILQHPEVVFRLHQIDTSDHHTHVAMRLVLALPITVGLLQSDARWRWLYAVLLVLQVLGLTFAGSRIGWLTLGVVALYVMVSQTSRVARIAFASTVLLVTLLAVSAPAVRDNFATLASIQRQENFWHRALIYQVAGRLFAEHPIQGIGFSHQTFREMGAQMVPGFYYGHPHNLVLTIAVYLGYLGLIPFALIIVRLVQALGDLAREAALPRPLLEGITAGLLGLALVNMAETAFSSDRVTLLAFVLIGLVHAMAKAGPGPIRVESRAVPERPCSSIH